MDTERNIRTAESAERCLMDAAPHFEVVGDHAICRPAGQVSFEQAKALLLSAISLARERDIQKLVFVVSALKGFSSPGLGERYFLVAERAKSAAGKVRLAMVAHPSMIDPQKFGVTVAQNLRLDAEVFTSEEEALAWLES